MEEIKYIDYEQFIALYNGGLLEESQLDVGEAFYKYFRLEDSPWHLEFKEIKDIKLLNELVINRILLN